MGIELSFHSYAPTLFQCSFASHFAILSRSFAFLIGTLLQAS